MYGILKANKCRHSTEQYNQFKAYYCGLCESLGTNFGTMARLAVNYDITFFYLVLDSVVEDSRMDKGFCPTAPWQKRDIIINDQLFSYISAVNIYLTGLKLKDDLHDENSLIKQLGYQTFQGKFEKASKILNSLDVDVTHADHLLEQQFTQETTGTTLADYYQTTAQGLHFLLAEGSKQLGLDESRQELLAQFGYELGKVIYIMDSFVDYPSDTKNERFNALAQIFGDQIKLKEDLSQEIRIKIYEVLNNSIVTAIDLLERLELKSNQELIQQILTNLQQKVLLLVQNTKSMEEVEQIVQASSPTYLLKHPVYFFKSRAARRTYYHRQHSGGCCCCPDCDNLITTAICCDAADCDCDAIECLSSGNPCELFECFC